MSDMSSPPTLSSFDVVTCIVSSASLLGSAFSATLLIPSALNRDLYGGTAALAVMIIFLQLLGLVAAVGVPSPVLLLRRLFRLSRVACWLLAFASVGVVIEVLALSVIPKGSNC